MLTKLYINSFKSLFISFFSDNINGIFLKNGLLFILSLIVFSNLLKISKLKIFSKINFLLFKSSCKLFNKIFYTNFIKLVISLFLIKFSLILSSNNNKSKRENKASNILKLESSLIFLSSEIL